MIVISGFPGVGKSTISRKEGIGSAASKVFVDHDSSSYSWVKDPNGGKVRNPDFPANYVRRILEYRSDQIVMVSSHREVRDEMVRQGIRFVLVFPADTEEMRAEFLRRYRSRGDANHFVELVDKNWSAWVDDCQSQDHCLRMEIINIRGDLFGCIMSLLVGSWKATFPQYYQG